MAQFVYTMHRVGKVVPPKRHILKNISLSFFPGAKIGNDSNLLIVFYVQIMPDDLVMQLHRF